MRKLILGTILAGTLGTTGVLAADARQDPYIDRGTHFELPITSDIPQDEKVLIAKDKAEMTLTGWRGEYSIKISPQIPTSQLGATDRDFRVEATRPLLSKRMEHKAGAVTAFIEPKEGTQNKFDIDFTLDSKPDTNVFTYKIEGAEEFDFFYQPELTQEEIDEGAERPENVVGSYAVYHRTKANHRVGSTNYATGKAFHIYRPKAIDANGSEVWAELNYDNGILSVTVPRKFLDDAVYPVRVDPTFGIESLGATKATNCNAASLQRRGDTPETVSGTLDSISVALAMNTSDADSSETFYFYVNDVDSDGPNSHGQVAKYSDTFALTQTAIWFTLNASSEALDGGLYEVNAHPANFCASTNETVWLQDTVAAHNVYSENFSVEATAQEDPWTNALISSTLQRSIYATYTASAAATPTFDDTYFEILD